MKYLYLIYLFIKYNFYRKGKKRYFEIYKNIYKFNPINICEIGIYTGERSHEIIKLSSMSNNKKINFIGFDMFEDISDKKIEEDFSKKPLNMNSIENNLNKLPYLKSLKLVKGNTNKILPDYYKNLQNHFDFIFIDGGHSIETINNDFKYSLKMIKNNGFIILDDYYHSNKKLTKYAGCNNLIDNLDNNFKIEISDNKDTHISPIYGRFEISVVCVQKII